MTDIPGTQMPSKKKEVKKEKEEIKEEPAKIVSVAVSYKKKAKQKAKDPYIPREEKFDKKVLLKWIGAGSVTALVVFGILAIINTDFIFLIILGPIGGAIAWFIINYMPKNLTKTDNIIKGM